MNKLDSSSTKDALCKVGLKFANWFWRRRFFTFVNVFSLFRNYLPLEVDRVLHLNKLGSPCNQGCFVPSLVEIGPAVLEKKISLISWMYFRYFVFISPWKGEGHSFKQTWIPVTKGCIVPSVDEIGPLVLEKKIFFLILSMYFSYFVIISPCKGQGHSFEQSWIESPKHALCQVWLTLIQWFLRENWF